MMILLEQQKTELTRQQKEREEKELQLKHTAQQNSDLQTETETLRSVISSQKAVPVRRWACGHMCILFSPAGKSSRSRERLGKRTDTQYPVVLSDGRERSAPERV
ncbi:hypothetical protein NFI96_001801 [Prochilodus magdalenae]|nr:hypothetical protein NFI96_001801 [Prochilodus magdalenae]